MTNWEDKPLHTQKIMIEFWTSLVGAFNSICKSVWCQVWCNCVPGQPQQQSVGYWKIQGQPLLVLLPALFSAPPPAWELTPLSAPCSNQWSQLWGQWDPKNLSCLWAVYLHLLFSWTAHILLQHAPASFSPLQAYCTVSEPAPTIKNKNEPISIICTKAQADLDLYL